MATFFLETTESTVSKTLGEITSVLVGAGATAINTMFDKGKPAGLHWSMHLYGKEVWFTLPVKVEPVFRIFWKRKSKIGRPPTEHEAKALLDKAERVAWRQLLMWIKLQMAMIQLEMVEFAEVFLPYVQDTMGGTTVWESFKGQKFRQLEAGSK